MKKSVIAAAVMLAVSFSAAAQWAPVGDNIKTKWAEEVDPTCPLPEYPRPQMVRQNNWVNLNGLWDYSIQPLEEEDFTPQGKILVPFCAESSLSGVGQKVGDDRHLWYERTFSVPKSWKGKRVMLNFGAVDWRTDVWVNGIKVGDHEGGYTPFSFDITDALKKSGRQSLRVRVYDATDNSLQASGKQVNYPSGIWYTAVTGIWQTVWLEAVPETRVLSYYTTAEPANRLIRVHVDACGLQDGDVVKVSLLEGGIGYNPEKPSTTVIDSRDGLNVALVDENIRKWNPENPYLYGLSISIVRNGKVVDSVDGYAAARRISAKRDRDGYLRMALNGECLFQYGPLDQGWWPDGLYTAPTDEALRFDIVKTKEWGYNMIRKHIKVEPARWYFYCDQEGMLVWQDMPSIGARRNNDVSRRSPEMDQAQRNRWVGNSFMGGTDCNIPQEWKDNYYREWKDIMESFRVFPSIVVWVPFNEAWGQFDTKEAVRFTKKIDSSRLVNPASGGNFVLSEGDILDSHHYPHPRILVHENNMITVLGEYGGLGLPVKDHLWQKDQNWGYGGVKADGKEVLRLYTQFAERLKVLVSTGCAAAVYTQTTDVEGEVNGLMTYDRKVIKLDEQKLHDVNQAVIRSMCK